MLNYCNQILISLNFKYDQLIEITCFASTAVPVRFSKKKTSVLTSSDELREGLIIITTDADYATIPVLSPFLNLAFSNVIFL